ncbi:uncharacterized protein LODBEIA_P55280 [Lodderomyces beijingensis]|uniref:Uncharacterized protein n=1 Tax=Lodderomyces beijingensis TaxID=1775926 RepID=A0ABP0ZT44_9ASCO
MSNELLSIEETNKLRTQLGLKPIPLPANEQPPQTSNGSHGQGRVNDAVSSISIEQTNQLRASLGLKLIPIPIPKQSELTSGVETADARDQELRRKIEQARSTAAKRKASALEESRRKEEEGDKEEDEEEGDIDTDDWLKKLGSKSKVAKKQKVPKASKPDEVSATIGHSSAQLRGLRNNEVLTLEDSDLLDGESEAILTNERLLKRSKLDRDLKERQEAEMIKFSGSHYRPNGGPEESLVDEEAEYDSDSAAAAATTTVINRGKVVLNSFQKSKTEELKPTGTRTYFQSLFDDIEDASDKNPHVAGQVESQLKLKKIKKKKPLDSSRASRVRRIGNDELEKAPSTIDVDYDELEDEFTSSMNANRSAKQNQKRKKMTPEEMAAQIVASKRLEDDATGETETKRVDFARSFYDDYDASGFLSSLESKVALNAEAEDVMYEGEDKERCTNSIEKVEPMGTQAKGEEQKEEKEGKGESESEGENGAGPTFNGGLADTLKFLQSRNLIASKEKQAQEKSSRFREEQAKKSDLLSIKINIERRVLEEEMGKDKSYMKLSKAERAASLEKELDKRLREKGIVEASHEQIGGDGGPRTRWKSRWNGSSGSRGSTSHDPDKFKLYEPKVELSYKDDEGRVLSTKQAYKHLSHKYHGTGLSKRKNGAKSKDTSKSDGAQKGRVVD